MLSRKLVGLAGLVIGLMSPSVEATVVVPQPILDTRRKTERDPQKLEVRLQALQKSLTLYKKLGMQKSEIDTIGTIADIYFKLGRLQEAELIIRDSINEFREKKDDVRTKLLVEVLRQYLAKNWKFSAGFGVVADREIQEKYRDGEFTWEKVLSFSNFNLFVSKQVGDGRQELESLHGIGWAYRNLGKFYDAMNYYDQAIKIAKLQRFIPYTAFLYVEAGLVQSDVGLYAISLESFQRSLSISSILPKFDQYQPIMFQKAELSGFALTKIGMAYISLRQYDLALKYLQRAYAENYTIDYHNTLLGLGIVYSQQGDYSGALTAYRGALQRITIGDPNARGEILNQIGLLYTKQQNYSKALESFQEALLSLEPLNNAPGKFTTLSNIASLLEKQDQPELAITFYKESVNVTESIRQGLRKLTIEEQKAYTESVAGTYRALADLLLKQDRILEAQQVLDLLKLQELSDSLKDTRSTPQPIAFRPAERQLLEKFNQQQQGAIAAAQELKTLLDRPEPQRSPQDRDRIRQLQQLQEAIAANFIQFIASAEVQTLTAQLRRKDSGSLDPDFLNQLQNKLSNQLAQLPHTALFYPLILDDRLELILILPDSSPLRRTVPIKREDLNRAISSFSNALKDPSQDAKPSAQDLYNILIQPIAADLKQANITTLLYSPDRRLRYVPLPALHDGKQWLLERLTINYITTASTTDLTTPRQPQPQVLAGAISDNRQQQYTVNLPQAQRQFLGLPNVSQELNGIAAQLPNTRTLRDRAFTVDAIKSLSRQYNILHFATHGSFERDRPELSFILFGDNGSDGKNYATLQDIGTWKLNADLVILSACETGLADDQFTTKADDSVAIMGLGYRFEQAGARATIASLWTVNDASTSVLMQQFYANLTTAKTTKSEALRQAQLSLLNTKTQPKTKADRNVVHPLTPNQPTRNDRIAPGYTHPYYWAPFILIGNGL
jgi:CHAT domain-containing protein/tetratricopeptide (TPR) repeat protein